MDYRIILYIIFGILPSVVWLSYYLGKDLHPESKLVILRIFLWGAFATVPVYFMQLGLANLLESATAIYGLSDVVVAIINWFLVIAFAEEIFIYLIVRVKIYNDPELDEPLDVMLYMVVATLGFAALENILYLFNPGQMSFFEAVSNILALSAVRFFGATLLHTLSSGVLGYFMAISCCESKTIKKLGLLFLGMFLAVGLHGFYDFSLMFFDSDLKIIIPASILVILSVLVFLGFKQLTKMKGTCKVNI